MASAKIRKLKVYKVWYSNRSSGKVMAFSIQGARKQAWDMLGGFKFGWSRADFMRNATVERLNDG